MLYACVFGRDHGLGAPEFPVPAPGAAGAAGQHHDGDSAAAGEPAGPALLPARGGLVPAELH